MASQNDSTDQHPKSLQLRDLKIGQKIGKGGFSKVYGAEWMNTPCVIKRFRKSERDVSCDNILRESHIWSDLKHPNIVPLYEVVTEEGSKLPSFLLERMDTSLGKNLAKTKETKEMTFPFASKFEILLHVSRGLLYLHQRSFIHGDLTANNVLLRIKGQWIEAKISDFGMSRVAEGSDRRHGTTTARGVEGYMAPEVKNGSPELASDVYSFGVLTIHTCTHDLPAPKYPMEVRDGKEIILSEMERFDLEFSKLSDGDKQFCLSLVGQCLHRVPSNRLTAKTLLEKMLELRNTVPDLETEDEASKRPQSINYNVFSITGSNISGSDLSLDISRLSKQHRPEIQLPSAKRMAIQDDGKSDSKEEGYSSRDSKESYNPSIRDLEATGENEKENDKSDSEFEEEGNSKSEDSEESCTSLIQDSKAIQEEMTENQHETENKEATTSAEKGNAEKSARPLTEKEKVARNKVILQSLIFEQVRQLYSVIGITDPGVLDKLPKDGYLLEAARRHASNLTQHALCVLGLEPVHAEILTKFIEGERSIERYIHIGNLEKKED